MKELPACNIFHFAGHGQSYPTDQSERFLLCSDWKNSPLTVQDLMSLKLYQKPSLLVCLSACSTGSNKVDKLQDEGIHLMSACQLAGFQHVVGMLWPVLDKDCLVVASEVYDSMLKGNMRD